MDENNKLYRKSLLDKKDKEYNNKFNLKKIILDTQEYGLLIVPEVLDILDYINNLHIEDAHKGIISLRNYISEQNIYLEGITFIVKFIINNCESYNEKGKKTMKRESPKRILTYYHKQRYLMDLTDLP